LQPKILKTETRKTLMEILKGRSPLPWRVLLYATPGWGKSTLATFTDKPLFLDVENGLSRIDCERTPHLKTFQDFEAALRFAYKSDYKTIVIDTLGALEDLLMKKIVEDFGIESLGDMNFGKGYEKLHVEWLNVLKALETFQENEKNVLLIGHDQIERFQDPTEDDYDRYSPKVHKKAANSIISRMDAVIFGKWETYLKEKSGDKTKKRALGTGRRVLHTAEEPAFIAKNRFGLEREEEFNNEFWQKLA